MGYLEAPPPRDDKGHRSREVEGDSTRQRDKEVDGVECLRECLQLVWSSQFRRCRKDV
jgi:hypothetical protein